MRVFRQPKPLKSLQWQDARQQKRINKLNISCLIMNTDELKTNIEKALDEIRPFLESDGGYITLVDVLEGKHVRVRLEGACVDCSVNQMTLKAGVETTIKKHVPQIETVENIA